MADDERGERINVTFPPEQYRQIERLARQLGLTLSATVRMLVSRGMQHSPELQNDMSKQ